MFSKAARHEDFKAELAFVTRFYDTDLNPDVLKTQLEVYSGKFADYALPTLGDIFSTMKNLSSAQKQLLSEVCTLTKLVLVMPATSAVSERSFSALR